MIYSANNYASTAEAVTSKLFDMNVINDCHQSHSFSKKPSI